MSFGSKLGKGSVLQGVGGVISGGLSSLFGGISASRDWKYRQKEMAKQQEYNERNMALQFDYAKKAFDMENEWNDPRNAVARWRGAGVAPQAVYGSSPGGAGVSAQLGTPDSSNPSAGSVGQYSGQMPNLAESIRIQNESDIAESQVELNKAMAEKARTDAGYTEGLKDLLPFEQKIRELNIEGKEYENLIKSIDALYSGAQKEQDIAAKDAAINKVLAEIDNLVKTGKLTEAQTEQVEAYAEKLRAETRTENETRQGKVDLLSSQNAEAFGRIGLTRLQSFEILKDAMEQFSGTEKSTNVAGFLDKWVSRLARGFKGTNERKVRDELSEVLIDILRRSGLVDKDYN